jgi:hypothetical protein
VTATLQAVKGSTPQTPAEQEAEQERQQQAVLSAELGLSIVSAVCRLPDVAATSEALHQVPALVRVVVAGGVTPVLLGFTPASPATVSASAAPTAAETGLPAQGSNPPDEAAVSEALESLLAMASASSTSTEAGAGMGVGGVRAAMRRAGGLRAACAALARAAQLLTAPPVATSTQQQPASSTLSNPWHVPVLGARLLSLLLEEEGAAGRRAAILTGVCIAMNALGNCGMRRLRGVKP